MIAAVGCSDEGVDSCSLYLSVRYSGHSGEMVLRSCCMLGHASQKWSDKTLWQRLWTFR